MVASELGIRFFGFEIFVDFFFAGGFSFFFNVFRGVYFVIFIFWYLVLDIDIIFGGFIFFLFFFGFFFLQFLFLVDVYFFFSSLSFLLLLLFLIFLSVAGLFLPDFFFVDWFLYNINIYKNIYLIFIILQLKWVPYFHLIRH